MSIQELNKSIIANDLTLAESLIARMDTVDPPKRDFSLPPTEELCVSPLFLAAKHKCLSLVKRLLEKGADINYESTFLWEGSRTLGTPLCAAIMVGDLEITKFLYEKGVTSGDHLNFAARHGQLSIVKYFLESGIDIESRYNEWEFTPLQLACDNGNLELCEYLVEHGANINHRHDDFGTPNYTCLQLAAENGHADIAKYLLDKGAKVELDEEKYLYYQGLDYKKSNDLVTDDPLHLACIRGHLEMVKLLVERGANVNRANAPNGCEFGGCTPLRIAVGTGNLDLVKYLLSKGAKYNSSDLELANSSFDEEKSRDELYEKRKGILELLEGK